MLLSINDYSITAKTTREEAYSLACDFAKTIGQDLKPKRKTVSKDKHSVMLIKLGHKGKKFLSERAAVLAAVACFSEATNIAGLESTNAFLSLHRATLSVLNWDCVTHKAPSVRVNDLSIHDLKRYINKNTSGDCGVRAASLEALYKVFYPKGDIYALLDKHACIQFCEITNASVSENISAHKAFLSIIAKSRETTRPILVTKALALFKVPSKVLELPRQEAMKTIRRARNLILVNDSEDHASESDKGAAKVRQQKVNVAFDTLQDYLDLSKSEFNKKYRLTV